MLYISVLLLDTRLLSMTTSEIAEDISFADDET